MDSLGSLNAFVQAAEARSFTVAGRQLGVSSSAIGKAVARIEERLGMRFFPLRSTGHVRSVFDKLGPLCLYRIPRQFTSGDRSVELRRLGTSGLRVSALSLGAMTFGASQTLMKRGHVLRGRGAAGL